MANGKNPLSYSDFFDITDDRVINSLINRIKEVNKEYDKLAKSVESLAKAQTDSLTRSTKELIEATKGLSTASEQDRKAMIALSDAVDDLKKRHEAQINTQKKSAEALSQAQSQYDTITQKLAQLRQEYIQLQQAEVQDEKAKKAVAKQIRENNTLLRSLTAEYKTSRQAITGVAGSYTELEQRIKASIARLKAMPDALRPVTDETKQLIADIKAGNQQLKDFDKQIGIYNRNVGNYADGFKNVSSAVLGFSSPMGGAILAITALTQMASEAIKSNLEFEDSLSDVQRTAGLTAEEVDNLAEQLKKIDTRTSLKGLIDIAVIGGQLGIAKDELAGFTEAIDQLAVVLDKEISGGAEKIASSLGKVNTQFKVAQKEGISTQEAMLKTGSAILQLGQSGIATGDFLVEFSQRVGDVANRAGISIPVMLSFGATLEESGISAETASSAFNNLIKLIARQPKDFFKVASLADTNMNLKEFTELINTDTSKALTLFAKGLSLGGGKMTEFQNITKLLGINSDELNRVVASLVGSIGDDGTGLISKINGAQKAYQDGSLATDQFRIKNENLAGALARLGNIFTEAFADSSLSKGTASLINALIDGTFKSRELEESFKNQQAALNPLLKTYDELKAKADSVGGANKLTKEEQSKLNQTIQDIAKILPDAIKGIDDYGNVIDITRTKVNELVASLESGLKKAFEKDATDLRNSNSELKGLIESRRKIIQGTSGFFDELYTVSKDKAKKDLEGAIKTYRSNILKLRDVLKVTITKEEESFLQATDPKAIVKDKPKPQKQTGTGGTGLLSNLGVDTKKNKEAKTDFEKLTEQINKFSLAIENQALKGKVAYSTLYQYAEAVKRLDDAQFEANLMMARSVDTYKSLQTEASLLQDKIQEQIRSGENFSTNLQRLTVINEEARKVQNAYKLAIAETVGGIELLNTKLELSRQQFEKEAVQGNISNKTFSEFQKTTEDVAEAQIKLQRATLQATDPMGLLNFEIEQLAGAMQRQVLQGGLSAETINKYADSLINLNKVQEKLKDAQNPFFAQDVSLLQAETALAKITPGARKQFDATGGGKQVDEARKIEQQVLQARIDRINAEQEAYDTSYKRWYELELEKTQILAQQEENRTRITKEKQDKRNRIVEESTQLLTGLLSGLTDIAKINADNELAYLEQKKNKELEITGNNSDAKAAIEKKYAKQQAEIRRRQAENEKKMALFEIAIQTAIAVSKAVASSPLTFGLPWSAFALATGALQAGLVLAKPVPAYAKGTKNAPEGLAIVGERGTEAIESKDGSVRLTQNKAHLAYLQQGDIVHTADSKETRMYKDALSGISGGSKSSNAYADAYQSINSNKRKFEDNRVTQMARQMQLSPEAIATAMQKAIRNELVIERHTFDENGYSSYRNKKGLSVKKLNSRNTFGSQG